MNINLKRAVVGLTLSLSMGVASAGTVNLGSYTFSYDDNFWSVGAGTVLSQVGNLFTFSNLGYSADTSGKKAWSYAAYSDSSLGAINITAKPGFQIASVDNGAAGRLSAVASNTNGAQAYASVSNQMSWQQGAQSSYSSDNLVSNTGQSNTHDYSINASASFAPKTTFAVGDYYTWGQAGAISSSRIATSSASASLDAVSFNVSVTPVPEPSSLALMLGGFGLVGFMSSRRRKYL